MPPKRKEAGAADTPERRSARATKKVSYNDSDDNEDEVAKTAPSKRAKKAKAATQAPDVPVAENGKAEEEGAAVEKTEASEPGEKLAESAVVAVGDTVDLDIKLETDEGKQVTLGELVSDKGAVIFLYPKANTPGCTTQACAYRDNYQQFADKNYQVFGISQDSPKSLSTWKAKHDFPYTLLSDKDQLLIKVLGGSKTAKSVARSHFVIEKGGKLLHAAIGVKAADSYTKTLEVIAAA